MTKNFSNCQRRTKTKFPKVRTGCLTCKSRKLKCDEAKPACLRCIKNDLECRGYAPPKTWIFDPHARSSQPDPPALAEASFHHANTSYCTRGAQAGKRNTSAQSSFSFGARDLDTFYAGDDSSLLYCRQTTPSDSLPLVPYALSEEYHHLQFYLEKVEPSISCITPYENFWKVLVPQIAWHDGAIRHLITAMSFGYRENIGNPAVSSEGDKKITEQCNLAIKDWSKQCNSQNSACGALVMSRIISLINYVGGEFELSKMHRRHGMRIARQTLASSDSDGDSRRLAETLLQMNLCGPGFLADEDPVVKMVDETRLRLLSTQQQTSLRHLKNIRQDYENWMFATPRRQWLRLPTSTRRDLLVSWGLMNRTIGSLFNPETASLEAESAFGRMFAARTRRDDRATDQPYTNEDGLLGESLHIGFKALMEEIDDCIRLRQLGMSERIVDATARLSKLTNIFLTQASDILELENNESLSTFATD